MSARPNFIKAGVDGEFITLRGESDPQPPGDIIHIHVVLTQRKQTAGGEAAPLGADWQARVPAEAGFGVDVMTCPFASVTVSRGLLLTA